MTRALYSLLLVCLLSMSAFASPWPTARQTLPLGHVISAMDLVATTGGVPSDYIGARTLTVIPTGRAITPDMIRTRVIIERNQRATAYFRKGAITLTIHARALSSGRIGDAIELLNLASRKKIIGTIQEDGTLYVH